MENDTASSRAEFLARVQKFTDAMLDRVNERSRGKDADDRDIGMLGNIVLKSLKVWDKALADSRHDQKLQEDFLRLEKKGLEKTSGKG